MKPNDYLTLTKNCSSMDTQAFKNFENAVFFKIFKIPFDRQLILFSNLTKIFFEKKIQQLRSLELSKIWAEMGRCGQVN